MKKQVLLFLSVCFFVIPSLSFGFTFTVTPTTETCSGNASLTFAASGTNPSGTLIYIVYKLPNTTTPFATVTNSVLNGLTSGNYRIIAKETVGNASTTQQLDTTITSAIVPLDYTIKSLNQACSATSTIKVDVTSGTAATYEIFSGPLIFPPQTSNSFSGLPLGTYKIKVIDVCGNALVQTFRVTLNVTNLTVSNPIFSDATPQSCNSIVATNTITPASGTVIGYPLVIQYTLHIPGATNPTVINETLSTGNLTSQAISQTIPYFINQSYPYDILITDACGTTYPKTSFVVDLDITFTSAIVPLDCDKNYFTLTTTNFTAPYTLNFTSAPAGFNPALFNSTYPGPYSTSPQSFGSISNPVPFGNYTISISDACNRTKTTTVIIASFPPIPKATCTNNGCLTNSGKIVATIPNYKIQTATITVAPASYPFPLPHDVTASITPSGILVLDPVPLGSYVIVLTDNCNDVLAPLNASIPLYVDQGISLEVRQGCDLQKAAVKIISNNSKLASVKITTAPPSFPFTLPYDGIANITALGEFYMNNLPAGSYTFETVDVCNFTGTKTVVLDGYTITNTSFSLVANCGSFDIPLNFVSNGTVNESFWLQKLLNNNTNSWGNPITGTPYVDGTLPDANTSYSLNNGATNYNLTFNGTFRIIRSFFSYNNGSEVNSGSVSSSEKNCLEILSPTLSFAQALEIKDIYRMPCTPSGNLDVIVITNGTPPLHYSIVEKNGTPFLIDNGSSNIFYSLAPAIYKFQIEDSCGNSINRIFDVSALASLVNIATPCDMLYCTANITNNEVFDLTTQSATILGTQSPTDYTLTYYTSLANAEAGTNPITNLTQFNPTTNPQTIYVRLVFNQLSNCYQTDSFNLVVGQVPKINLNPNYFQCSTVPVSLDASPNNLASTNYLWSNGITTPTITVSQVGVNALSLTAYNTYGSCNTSPLECTFTKNITITLTEIPKIDHIETQDWTENENSISVFTSSLGSFEYSLDDINYQDNNSFTNLTPGLYTVYVRDKSYCKTIKQQVWLLYYPKFFTPNADGYNDTWVIKYSEFEPEFKVIIYDRYGKMMTSFDSNSLGWDGNYNGKLALATDYWFVVYRQDGRIHKGHFSLIR